MTWKQRTTPNSIVKINTPACVSIKAQGACAQFGLITQPTTNSPPPKTTIPDDHAITQINNARVILISGFSGSGKTCLLRGIKKSITNRNIHAVNDQPITSTQSIFDLLTGTIEQRVSVLSQTGLAEPKLWAMPFHTLSAGEQARFQLALAMQHAHSGDVLIADEFCTPLDRISAQAVAYTVRRWALRNDITLIVAAAHEDMKSLIAPDLVINASTTLSTTPVSNHDPVPITIENGTIADYHQLAHHHYRSGKPATHTLVLRAMRSFPITMPAHDPILAGVIVISMPTLNGAWRNRAWPGHFNNQSKSDNAKRINRDLRCISRVIIDPRSRGLGIASNLVRHYLANPQTPATESIAAMGSICPFFERAGMKPYTLIHTNDDLRLLDAIEHEQLVLNDLISKPITPDSLIARELYRWGKLRKVIPTKTPTKKQSQSSPPSQPVG